jgi:hypothetical protein
MDYTTFLTIINRVLDPDSVTFWIRIRIGNPDPGARKLRNFSEKNAVVVNTGIFYLI